ncbi:excinuclease ABC subunit UvrA [Coprothermobacteraceae bacterium]|nr:excinuclease ABC subunit UvrA [Coprothermobacteraceae bacterium]
MDREIILRGVRHHNLKNLSLNIPREKYIVVTGVSGSGKSTLAFDVLYAEAHRRYIESLSGYARMFLGIMQKPDVDFIEGIPPAISVEQKTASHNPRSIVGTVTEIYDYLRLLFAHVGVPYCPEHNIPMLPVTVDEIVEKVLTQYQGRRIHVLAPMVRGKKGEHQRLIEQVAKLGYTRVLVDDIMYDVDEPIELDKNQRHSIEVVTDRLTVSSENRSRIADAVEQAFKLAEGVVAIMTDEGKEYYSQQMACPICGRTLPELSPRLFSFNSPYGACPVCHGLGFESRASEDLVVDHDSPLMEAIIPYRENEYYQQLLYGLARQLHIDTRKPFKSLPEDIKEGILRTGFGHLRVPVYLESGREVYVQFKPVLPEIERRIRETESEDVFNWYYRFIEEVPCSACGGSRLRPEALWVKIGGADIFQVSAKDFKHFKEWLSGIEVSPAKRPVAQPILQELQKRVDFMLNIGLDYIQVNRRMDTLSGGESQRVRLASQLGSGLTGVLYVLDEPSIGLHPRDSDRLVGILRTLRDEGNTVVVVEHDTEIIESADHVVDLGPLAGKHGGEVVFQGTPKELKKSETLTGLYLSGRRQVPIPLERRQPQGWIRVKDASLNNLKHIDVNFPMGVFTVVTGVSGSGKSSLVIDTLHKGLNNYVNRKKVSTVKLGSLTVEGQIKHVVLVDQSPIGRTPRSNPATYTGVWTPIRELFASLRESKERGYKAGRFSFNVPSSRGGGRCEACRGEGQIKVEMALLPDVYVTCEVCGGKRFNKETLEVKYKGLSIADVLELTVDEALDLFKDIPAIRRTLEVLQAVGLGYIELGQSATTLSGGEAQRVKLATYLKSRAKDYVFILDEPTTGLHAYDVEMLLKVLHQLVDQGNTVIVVEHNLDVVGNADYIIDLGPEGGEGGGYVVFAGTSEQLIKHPTSYTGKYLAEYWKRLKPRLVLTR